MGAPAVTVLIPIYDRAEYLGEAIRSVLSQTFAGTQRRAELSRGRSRRRNRRRGAA
jgi:hypothetical protein